MQTTSSPVVADGATSPGHGMIRLTGTLSASSLSEAETIRSHLPKHISLSRHEPGCLRFDVVQTDDPFVWALDELFIDDAAFAAHQARTSASEWGDKTRGIARDFKKLDAIIQIREELSTDIPQTLTLLAETFDGVDEARVVQMLREDGDLEVSLVAEAGGAILGHTALSPLQSERPALALAPLAVLPRAQGHGIASALVREAIRRAGDRIVVVLGEPDFYCRFGFQPVNWESRYAGPFLQAVGPELPERMRITHAPAFSCLA
ncbi:GNAT family N-acetyltransferase [Paracoccus aminophilus]|uniref:GCN5-related N-acetyltransferase n=1 Tax=Paracoccus aminophilus JCM 7686 TaxID=1367847 RepID=S5XUU6_PARAH|nr:GNAT family N-acetyltransferase [Paracoccus aminophilus]AGT08997.1 GCN5-related N-acetyltransferase [Paracoccus aminophilus JCM 7686]